MADLGTIGIAIEVRGREALRQIESDMGIVDKTAKSAARSFEAFERAGLKTADTFKYMSEASKKRLAEEQKITQELIKQRSAAEQLARANAQKFQSQIGSNLGLGAQGISAGASAGAFEAEIERLRQKYDKIYASSQLYERSLTELNKAHALGVLSTKQHESALESLNAEYQNFQNGTAGIGNRFAQNVQQNMAGVNNAGVLMQQLGYQAGDFIVQVQSGTNAFVAFGQQATQMVGFLPMMAQSMNIATVSVLGFNVAIAPLTLGLSIIIPLLTAAGALWMRTGETAKKGKDGIDTYTGAIKALTEEINRNQEEFLKLKFNTESLGFAGASQQIEDITAKIKDLQANIDRMKSYGGRSAAAAGLLGDPGELEAQKQTLEAQLQTLRDQEEAQRMLNGHLSTAKGIAATIADDYKEAKAEADQWKRSIEGVKSVLDSMSGMIVPITLDMKSTASGWGAQFMSQLTAGLEAKRAYATSVGGGRGLGPQGPALDPYGFRKQLDRIQTGSSGSSGGSGGRASALQKEIDLTIELTQVEKDRENILESINSSLEDGFMSMVDGTSSVKDAFKSMARDIIKELYRVLVVQRLVGSITGGLNLFSGPSTGSLGLPFGGANASGGSMIPGKSYLVGENGPELVIPRHSGTVVNANQTANSGNSGGVTVQNNITVTGSDAAMVRAEVAKMIPQITNATKSAVIDARLRGGQMKQAFR